jgi:hypothetical protein
MGNADAAFNLDMGALAAQVQAAMTAAADTITDRIVVEARALAPVRSGRLKAAIRKEPGTGHGPFLVQAGVSCDVPYAKFVHDGTQPHVIRARNASVLAFQVGGRKVFARSVRHPGTRPNPFLRTAADHVLSDPSLSQTAT